MGGWPEDDLLQFVGNGLSSDGSSPPMTGPCTSRGCCLGWSFHRGSWHGLQVGAGATADSGGVVSVGVSGLEGARPVDADSLLLAVAVRR